MGRKSKSARPGWKRPVAGILMGGFAVLALLGLSSYRLRGGDDWAGPVGHRLAGALLEVAGVGGYAAALFLLAVACAWVAGRPRLSFARAGSWLLFSLSFMGLVDLLGGTRVQGRPAGWVVGRLVAGARRARRAASCG